MSKIPFINTADVNCWMVYIMPFDDKEKSDWELVNRVQRRCIQDIFFGMGWDLEGAFSFGEILSEEKAELFKEKYQDKFDGEYSVSDSAINGYLNIKKGDFVIARLRDSHYYVGKVSSERAIYLNNPADEDLKYFSWGCYVENWFEFSNVEEIPSEIVGRFSQRLHSTIQKISPYRLKFLVISLYESRLEKSQREYNIPKLRIGEYNFVRSMDYQELEDLVALFIYEKHKDEDYALLPSSCKVNEPKFEFRFVSNLGAPITCQVKNEAWVSPENYRKEDSYRSIYLFSGAWSEDDIKNLRGEYNEKSNIYIISRQELFETLLKHKGMLKQFYDYENEYVSAENILLENYNKCEKLTKKSKDFRNYAVSDDFICFYRYDGLFYSAEFDALVLSWHILWDEEDGINKELDATNQILADINRGR